MYIKVYIFRMITVLENLFLISKFNKNAGFWCFFVFVLFLFCFLFCFCFCFVLFCFFFCMHSLPLFSSCTYEVQQVYNGILMYLSVYLLCILPQLENASRICLSWWIFAILGYNNHQVGDVGVFVLFFVARFFT